MVKRNISVGKYILAGFITLVVFFLGLSVGLVIEGKRVIYIGDLIDQQKVEFASSQLQYDYIGSLDTIDSCPAIFQSFYSNLKNLDETRIRLENYARDSKINDESFNLLKRQYTLEQIRYWLLSQQATSICGTDRARILYFYGTDKDCPECAEQEFVLNYLKSVFGEDVLIFALDSNFKEEPLINVLKKRYSIQAYPTVVFGDIVYAGYQSKEKLIDYVCEAVDSEECKNL